MTVNNLSHYFEEAPILARKKHRGPPGQTPSVLSDSIEGPETRSYATQNQALNALGLLSRRPIGSGFEERRRITGAAASRKRPRPERAGLQRFLPTTSALSSGNICPELLGLRFRLGNLDFHQVADRDDSQQAAVFADR